MTDKLTFDFCEIHIYDDYMIVTINDGVTVGLRHNNTLINIADTYYKNKSFVYITHRINSYAVDPTIYKETSKIKNLAGFCVVSKNYLAKSTAQIEKLFLNKPFEIFSTLKEAIEWSKSVIK